MADALALSTLAVAAAGAVGLIGASAGGFAVIRTGTRGADALSAGYTLPVGKALAFPTAAYSSACPTTNFGSAGHRAARSLVTIA